ncbi:hypothetical protein Bca52824_007108 [Brassica carinata]|uniref:Uncharacterized protein n=1 Tax=Brassica carinata TaxID=52824 RepID=A0A8X7W8G3_BRACI|nr:hypothetical protein Bca52824_007108 [Brassica carinata]
MIGGREHRIERLRICVSIDRSSSGRELEARCRGQRIEQSGFSKWSLCSVRSRTEGYGIEVNGSRSLGYVRRALEAS